MVQAYRRGYFPLVLVLEESYAAFYIVLFGP